MFDVYLSSLVGSWKALAVPHPDAAVVEGGGYVAAVFPDQPVLNNALVLTEAAVAAASAHYPADFALWTLDEPAATVVEAAGFRRDETTYPMVSRLDSTTLPDRPDVTVHSGASIDLISELNGVGSELLAGVPGTRTYASADGNAGAALIEIGTDVNVSFVATRTTYRRRGLAAAVLATALRDARDDGFTTASLQSTVMARGLYLGLGFEQVGVWQEWVRTVSR